MPTGDGLNGVQVLDCAMMLDVKWDAGTNGGERDDGEGRVGVSAIDEYNTRGILECTTAAIVVAVVEDRGKHIANEQDVAVVSPAERVAEDLQFPLSEVVGILTVKRTSKAYANSIHIAGRFLLPGDLHSTVI